MNHWIRRIKGKEEEEKFRHWHRQETQRRGLVKEYAEHPPPPPPRYTFSCCSNKRLLPHARLTNVPEIAKE